MASASTGIPKLKKKNLPKIESTLYSRTTLNEQVVFAIHYLEQHGVAVTVEEVVSTCFRLFPQSFSLKHYTRWPDSALVIRRLNDSRERGFVKGSPLEGFALKYSGVRLAERTAKAFGLVKPVPAKKKAAPAKPQPVKTKKKAVAPHVIQKQVAAQVVKVLPKPQPKKTVSKQPVEQKVILPKKAEEKAVVKAPVVLKPSVKLQAVKKKVVKKIVEPKVVIPKKAAEKKSKPSVVQKAAPKPIPIKIQKGKARKVQPVQMTMTLPTVEVQPPIQPVKKAVVRKSKPAPQLTKLQAIQPEIIIPAKLLKPVPMPAVSKEEKIKAEKIVRAMERSDAYKLYSKNGHGSKPSEFDFRNMLFATMESTPETLVRNVNLFKGSAAIHNRQDLIAFLDYCETNFAGMLKPTVKKVVKKK